MNKIFISHSRKDKKVAGKFKGLFEKYSNKKTEVFLSTYITSDQIKSGEWRDNFEKNLRQSDLVVVLVTPNSLNSRWVQYETGFASSLGKEIRPIGIKGVSPEDFLLNVYSMQIVDDEDEITKLLSSIFGEKEEVTRDWCEKNEKTIKELIGLCKERNVYFVGSEPKNEEGWRQEFVTDFLNQVTSRLLNNGIRVSSFPSVKEVGKIVCESAMKSHPELYEISGLYNFDKVFEKERITSINQKTWKETLDGFRKLYLANKSSMIIIGGNEHTKDEYDVAEKEFNQIEVFPIPCMGGFGKELFNRYMNDKEKHKKFNHPCFKCKGIKAKCDKIDGFIKRLSQYNYINEEDER